MQSELHGAGAIWSRSCMEPEPSGVGADPISPEPKKQRLRNTDRNPNPPFGTWQVPVQVPGRYMMMRVTTVMSRDMRASALRNPILHYCLKNTRTNRQFTTEQKQPSPPPFFPSLNTSPASPGFAYQSTFKCQML